jgi:hypothetical protein
LMNKEKVELPAALPREHVAATRHHA